MAIAKATVSFPCPMERVWQTLTDLTRTAWRSDLERVEILDGSHFVEHTKSGFATRFTVTACEPPRLWAFTMENENLTGHWEGRLESAECMTRLTCTETVTARGWWMRPFAPGYLRRQQKRYLEDLQKELLKGTPS